MNYYMLIKYSSENSSVNHLFFVLFLMLCTVSLKKHLVLDEDKEMSLIFVSYSVYFKSARRQFFICNIREETYFKMTSISTTDLVALQDPERFISLVLSKRIKISPDTLIFRFALPSESHKLGLPIGQNIQVKATINGEDVIRAYSPVSSDDDLGFMDLLIKVYFKNVHPNFPNGGLMSQYIHALEVGQTLDIRGPTGRLLYHGQGLFETRPDKISSYNSVKASKVNMIAGGSGITPMLQIIKAILKNADYLMTISIIFANRTEDDILCREELESIRDKYPHRVKLWFTLDTPPDGWKFGSGFITADMLKSNIFAPSDETLSLFVDHLQ